jgi:hypothetical protein
MKLQPQKMMQKTQEHLQHQHSHWKQPLGMLVLPIVFCLLQPNDPDEIKFDLNTLKIPSRM